MQVIYLSRLFSFGAEDVNDSSELADEKVDSATEVSVAVPPNRVASRELTSRISI